MADIPSTSITVFKQSSALVGWTKLTSINDYTLRVVSGTVGSGGTNSFTTTFTTVTPTGTVSGSAAAGSTSLSESQLPSHNHTYLRNVSSSWTPTLTNRVPGSSALLPLNPRASVSPYLSSATGDGTGHQHPISLSITSPGFAGNALDFNLKYVDVILAQRD